MKRFQVLVAVAALALAGCGGGGSEQPRDEGAGGDTTTSAGGSGSSGSSTTADPQALAKEGETAFKTYIEAMRGGRFQEALDVSTGAAAAFAGYHNTLSQIPDVPAEFKAGTQTAAVTMAITGATRSTTGAVVLDGTASGASTDGNTTIYSEITLAQERGKPVVADYRRGTQGPISEDVFQVAGMKGEANGIAVTLGPGYGLRGAIGSGGRVFTNFVFSYTNNRTAPVSIRATESNVLNNAATLETEEKRHPSNTTVGTLAAPGGRGFGFVYFNAKVEGAQARLTLSFVEEGSKTDIDVPVPITKL